jgi:LPS-assembly protein
VRALRIHGARSIELVADGEAELRRDDITLTADKLTYREPTDEAIAEGNVLLRKGQDTIAGPAARLIVGDQVGSFDSPAYTLSRQREARGADGAARAVSGSGQADVLRFEGENQYRLENATWSTCQAGDPDWYLRARELELDYDREVGTARGGSIVFMDVPIFWMPWAEFPLNGQRQSGLLPPTFGSSNKTGVDFTVPYYWNIAPNYDATIAPRYMSRRGLQLGGEFRYLGADYAGVTRIEWLPEDSVTGEERRLGALQHQHRITPTLYGSLDLNAVSDDAYFEDLSSRVGVASRVNLLREGRLHYLGGSWWSASALVQSYQTLNPDVEVRNVSPYRRQPQLLLDALRPDLPGGLTMAFAGEYVEFAHPDADKAEAGRLTAYPQVALPMQGAAWFLTPKAGVHLSHYSLDRPADDAVLANSIRRTVPILSLDSGLIFERDARFFGQDFVQTLEPRLFYLNVPDRDQSAIPLFDTSRFDVGFAQIFAENRYSGSDRIGDANDLTAALSSRLIDAASGVERLRATIGQRYYFDDQKVTRNYDEVVVDASGQPTGAGVVTRMLETPRSGGRADLLAGLGGRITPYTSIDSYLQFNPSESETERFNAVLRYQPGFARTLNLSYRYARNVLSADGTIGLEDVDVSGQWPLGGGWYGVGRVTRSLKEDRVTEAIGGLEYDGGCWAVRVALHRFAIDADDATKAVFVQLELNDLASIGSNPVSLITRSVPGYGKINDSSADRVFGSE